ncbi:MAG: hypothetical protein JW738_07430 [Actinobacteria bacterium]|nr:hypothetical protein [Actinomycetota bacterium]
MCPDFKIESNSVDTEAIEREIEKRVRERQAAGVYSHEVESLVADRLPDEDSSAGLSALAALDYSSTRAMSSWGVTTAYPVATEKKIIAPLIIFVKRIARLWARVAVGPIQREQTAFNRHTANALNAVKKEAVLQRARERAQDEDLSELAGALIDDAMCAWAADAIEAELVPAQILTVLYPCPNVIPGKLKEKGCKIYKISLGSAWEEPEGAVPGTTQDPASFLCQAPEESIDSILISELSFMENPRILVNLLRKSYLALRKGGTVVVTVHGLTTGGTSKWSAVPVIEKALEMAGFKNIRIRQGTSDTVTGAISYIAFAGK